MEKKQYEMTRSEQLLLENLSLQTQLAQQQYNQQMDEIRRRTTEVVVAMSQRLGTDVSRMQLNIKQGVLTEMEECGSNTSG